MQEGQGQWVYVTQRKNFFTLYRLDGFIVVALLVLLSRKPKSRKTLCLFFYSCYVRFEESK